MNWRKHHFWCLIQHVSLNVYKIIDKNKFRCDYTPNIRTTFSAEMHLLLVTDPTIVAAIFFWSAQCIQIEIIHNFSRLKRIEWAGYRISLNSVHHSVFGDFYKSYFFSMASIFGRGTDWKKGHPLSTPRLLENQNAADTGYPILKRLLNILNIVRYNVQNLQ